MVVRKDLCCKGDGGEKPEAVAAVTAVYIHTRRNLIQVLKESVTETSC
jgi:hypothetical protein